MTSCAAIATDCAKTGTKKGTVMEETANTMKFLCFSFTGTTEELVSMLVCVGVAAIFLYCIIAPLCRFLWMCVKYSFLYAAVPYAIYMWGNALIETSDYKYVPVLLTAAYFIVMVILAANSGKRSLRDYDDDDYDPKYDHANTRKRRRHRRAA